MRRTRTLGAAVVLFVAACGSPAGSTTDAATGDDRWEADLDGPSVFVGDLGGGTAIVHGQHTWLAALDTSTGARRWRVDLDEHGYGVAGVTLVGDRAVVSTSASGEGDTRAPYVLLVDLADGRTLWRTDLDVDTEAQ